MYRHSEHRQQRWRSPDESHFTRGIHGGYLLSSSQGIFACVSSTTPSRRTEGCLVSPLGKPLFSRHAKVPHDEQFHFSPEESHGELWTPCVSLLGTGRHCCRPGQRKRMRWLQHGWEGQTGCLGLVVLGEKKCPDEPYSTMYPTCLAQPASKLCRTRGLLRLERSLQTTRSHHRLTPPHPKPECCADTALKHCSRDRTPYFGGKNSF